jgi:hypothetical protein
MVLGLTIIIGVEYRIRQETCLGMGKVMVGRIERRKRRRKNDG